MITFKEMSNSPNTAMMMDYLGIKCVSLFVLEV